MKKYGTSRKSLPCKICNETVENVGHETTAVTCYKCVSAQLRGLSNIEDEKEWDVTLEDGLDELDNNFKY